MFVKFVRMERGEDIEESVCFAELPDVYICLVDYHIDIYFDDRFGCIVIRWVNIK